MADSRAAVIHTKKKIAYVFDLSVYRIVYITFNFLFSVVFIDKILFYVIGVLLGWGVILTVYKKAASKRVLKIGGLWWLVAFLVSNTATMLMYVTNNAGYNCVMIFHAAICFFIFYGLHAEPGKARLRRELYYICVIIAGISTLLAIAGLTLLMLKVWGDKFVIYENRFTGLYSNPNLLAFSCVAAIFSCTLLTKKTFLNQVGKKPVRRWILVFCAVLNLLSLFLSDSNASILLLIFYFAFIISYKVFFSKKKLSPKQVIKKLCILAGAFCIVAASALTLRVVSQFSIVKLMTVVPENSSVTEEPGKPLPEITFEHENPNIDSGRITLLQQSSILISVNPIIGIGKGNIEPFGDIYIKGGLHFPDLHNGYLTILVSSGIVGFAIFIIFGIKLAKGLIVNLFSIKSMLSSDIYPNLIAFISAYCVFAFFEKAMLFDITFMVIFFWFVLGHATSYMVEDRRKRHLLDGKRFKLAKHEMSETTVHP